MAVTFTVACAQQSTPPVSSQANRSSPQATMFTFLAAISTK